jgi:diadenosine tetraphosphate (Ap4A) HIT family hydrolase
MFEPHEYGHSRAGGRGGRRQVDASHRADGLRLGDPQILPGYSLLLPDPVVPHLNALTGLARDRFLTDMATLGDAVLAVTNAERINYEILGNVEPALHAHVIPRYAWEAEALRRTPVWSHDWAAAPRVDLSRDGPLLQALAARLPPG